MGGCCSYDKPADKAPTAAYHTLVAGLPSLEGKTFAITGCTSGTGLCLAMNVASKGGYVVMLNRESFLPEPLQHWKLLKRYVVF